MKNITVEISAKGFTGLTTENIQKALNHYFGSPTLNVSFSVTEVAQQSAEKFNIFPACARCEYNPCDVNNNLDYCPAKERRIKFNPAIISG